MEDTHSNNSSPTELENVTFGFEQRRTFIRSTIPEEVRFFRRILNKITNDDRTYEGYLENILKITIVSPESPSENHQDLMKPVVSSFLGMIYEDKETNNTIFLYGRLFIDLVNRWSGKQGKLLLSGMILEINDFIKDYFEYNIPEKDIPEDTKRRRCFCILKFLYYVYDKNADVIPGKIIMVIMEKFFPTSSVINELHLEVFLRLLSQNYSKLKDEKLFQVKLKDKYHKFLKDNIETKFISRNYNYQIEDILKIF
jgi:hypothetical protein